MVGRKAQRLGLWGQVCRAEGLLLVGPPHFTTFPSFAQGVLLRACE
ncbi:MAG TPA: hypothetical protein VFA32_03225 [Dehalococcoidia bacterium]|nr:hypothetical protein [Dehalococcoidia bacterium]